jgi:hypothetical protein
VPKTARTADKRFNNFYKATITSFLLTFAEVHSFWDDRQDQFLYEEPEATPSEPVFVPPHSDVVQLSNPEEAPPKKEESVCCPGLEFNPAIFEKSAAPEQTETRPDEPPPGEGAYPKFNFSGFTSGEKKEGEQKKDESAYPKFDFNGYTSGEKKEGEEKKDEGAYPKFDFSGFTSGEKKEGEEKKDKDSTGDKPVSGRNF